MRLPQRTPRQVAFILVLGVVTLLTWSVHSSSTTAHDIGWEWDYADANPIVRNATSSYGVQIESARANFHNSTNMTVYGCPSNTNCGNIIHLQGNYGATGWNACVRPYSHGTPCSDGNCNPNYSCDHWGNKVNWSDVRWNDYYGTSRPHFVARHEMGHVFGLAHTPCSVSSVMQGAVCSPYPVTLTSHDINDLNAWY